MVAIPAVSLRPSRANRLPTGFVLGAGSPAQIVVVGICVALVAATFRYSASVPEAGRVHIPDWVILVRGFCKALWPTVVLLHALRFALERVGIAPRSRFVPDFVGYVRLVALVSTAGLPRFLFFDAMGGVPFSLWYGVVLVAADGVAVHYFDAGTSARRWIWRAGAVTLVPWGAYWWVPTWPDPTWALP